MRAWLAMLSLGIKTTIKNWFIVQLYICIHLQWSKCMASVNVPKGTKMSSWISRCPLQHCYSTTLQHNITLQLCSFASFKWTAIVHGIQADRPSSSVVAVHHAAKMCNCIQQLKLTIMPTSILLSTILIADCKLLL